MSLLNEIGRIKSVMGLVNEQYESKDQMNINLKKVVEIFNIHDLNFICVFDKNICSTNCHL
mgnify:CR=1 FL=1